MKEAGAIRTKDLKAPGKGTPWPDSRVSNWAAAAASRRETVSIPRPDGDHIHEDLPLPEVTFQPVVDPAGMGSAIVTAVADEDLRHHVPYFGALGR